MTEFTYRDLERITEIMYDEAAIASCSVYDGRGLPICRLWKHLSTFEKDTAIRGLKERIQRETISGYFERKKREVPAATKIYDETIRKLKAEGLWKD